MGIDEKMFFEFYKEEIRNKNIEEIHEWMATLDEEDRIKAHAYGWLQYLQGWENGRKKRKDKSTR